MLPFPDNLMIYPHGGVALRSQGTRAKVREFWPFAPKWTIDERQCTEILRGPPTLSD